jgi:hypothetical protein
VSEKFGEYGNAVLQKMQSAGLRAALDNRSEKICCFSYQFQRHFV